MGTRTVNELVAYTLGSILIEPQTSRLRAYIECESVGVAVERRRSGGGGVAAAEWRRGGGGRMEGGWRYPAHGRGRKRKSEERR
jgi:hypothetical protein